MKLFLDDIRDPPDDSWTVIRTYTGAWEVILKWVNFSTPKSIETISLDHDLGEEATGYDVLVLIEKLVADPYWSLRDPPLIVPELLIHSANPVGRQRMEQAIALIKKMTGT